MHAIVSLIPGHRDKPPAVSQHVETRRTVHFRGRVQGVGFRYTVCRIAAEFAVTGFVQNLPDGRVLLVAEGTAAELDALVGRVRETMDRYLTGLDDARGPATGQFSEFGVRY